MNKLKKKIENLFICSILFSFIFFFFSTCFAKITFKEVTVSGVGQSQEEAVNNALSEAISSVNGKNIQTQTIIKVLGGESIPKPKVDSSNKTGVDPNTQLLGKTLENIANIIKGNPTKEVSENKDKKSIKDDNQTKQPQYSQEYIKKLVDETKGGIKSYDILEKSKTKEGWIKVKIKAQVASFELPQEANRTRIAIFPFKIFNAEGDKEKLKRTLNQEVNNYFVQTRKFAVLDRAYIEEVAQEKSKILDGSAPAIEMAKIGNEISADFIVVGSVEDLKTETKTTAILTDADTKITRVNTIVSVNYRVIDIATKQISNSDTVKIKISGSAKDSLTDIAAKVAQSIGEEVLFSIYPALVEKVDGSEIYLGQGGKQFKLGAIYEIFEKGDKIIDSYTKEVIGTVESPRGKIQITSVSSNITKAKFSEKSFDIASNFYPGKYLVRPIKVAGGDEAANNKILKEKIDNQKQERKKKLDDAM